MIQRDLKKMAIDLSCDDGTLMEIIKEVIENNANVFFPAVDFKDPLTAKLKEREQFVDYEKHIYEPILTQKDLMRVNKILCSLITSGFLGINFFEKHYSGNDLELFRI